LIELLIITLIGLTAGTLIGTIGIGGVILVPLLTAGMGLDIHVAMPASSMSFLFPGLVGTFSYARKGSVDWNKVAWLSAGIVPAALMGAQVNSRLNSDLLTLIVAGLVSLSGANALVNRGSQEETSRNLGNRALILLGAAVGFGSALTGTGGPVLLVPILVLLGQPALASIGVSQAIQLPIALFAVLGFSLAGEIDASLGLHVGLAQAAGAFAGAQIAHALPVIQLRRLVAAALVGVGLLMAWRILAPV
jgi:uncharacterized membrane protein YfcA